MRQRLAELDEHAALYRAARRWTDLVYTLRQKAELVDDPKQEIDLQLALAKIYQENLHLDVMAIGVLNRALELSPGHGDALRQLARIFERMSRWTDMISILKRSLAATERADERVALHLQIADLFLRRFSNATKAKKAAQEALKIKPRHAKALRFLSALEDPSATHRKRANNHRSLAIVGMGTAILSVLLIAAGATPMLSGMIPLAAMGLGVVVWRRARI